MFAWAIGSTVLVSLISLVGVFTLALSDKVLKQIVFLLMGFSAGALLGGAFLHLIPEAVEKASGINIYIWIIFGILAFFFLERFLYWRHCHNGVCDVHTFTYLNLIGDGFHNLIDGMVIAASYAVGIHVGIVTTIAVISHEIPQELGDFGVLVYGGFSKAKALFWNLISGLTAIVGAILGFYFYAHIEGATPILLSFTAGGFIYIAASDLIPELHKERISARSNLAFLFFIGGLVFMWAATLLEH